MLDKTVGDAGNEQLSDMRRLILAGYGSKQGTLVAHEVLVDDARAAGIAHDPP
jgi:hypothetical protein